MALLASIALGLARPAEAQIYSWRDSNGTLVLSDRPTATTARTFSVPRATSVRTTRPVTRRYPNTYDNIIESHSVTHRVRPELVRAVIQVESAFNPFARSVKGAAGLMQLMPATAADFGVLNPFNAGENIRAGVAYLRQLLDRYGENEELALAAYNAGPGAVDRYRTQVPPFRETRQYVDRIKQATSLRASSTSRLIYKTVELVDGHPVPRYSDTKPASGGYEIITPR